MHTAAPDGANRNCSSPEGRAQAVKFARQEQVLESSLFLPARVAVCSRAKEQAWWTGGKGRNGKNSGISDVHVAQP